MKRIAFGFIFFVTQNLQAQDPYDRVEVLEERRYSLAGRFHFDLGLDALPLDAYAKPIAVEAAAAYSFNDLWTWEIARGGYSLIETDSGLESDIFKQTGASLPEKPLMKSLRFFAGSMVYANLLYSKSNFFNQAIIYHQWSLGAGPIYYDLDRETQIGAEVAAKVRFFMGDHLSSYLRASYSYGFKSNAAKNIMHLGAGLGFAF